MAIADRSRQPHQFDDDLMPGQSWQAPADVRDGILELLTTQGVKQVCVQDRHLAHDDVEILVPATHVVSIGAHFPRA